MDDFHPELLTLDRKEGALSPQLEGERHARLLLESVRDYAIFSLDPAGRVKTWTPGAKRLKGYSAEEVIGRHFSLFYPKEDVAAGKCEMELDRARREGRIEDEGWRIRKDGSRFWASVVISAMRDESGVLVGFAKVTRDLSERREAELKLRESEQRMRLLIASVRDYAIFMLDPTGRVMTWNPGAEQIKGYRAEEIIGRHISTFYTPEDRERGLPGRLLAAAAEQGRVENEGYRVRKDGTRFWADVVISAVRGPDGRLLGYSKVTRDLTERRQADELLRQSEQRARLILESVSDYAIYMLDPAGTILTWNKGAERVKGYTGEEILGKNVSLLYPERDRAAGKPGLELRIAADEGRYEDEGWRLRKDGTEFWASVVLSAIRDATGNLLGFAKVTRDLTERRRAEEERLRLLQAQESLRMRDEFLSIAAHELRTPLTALQIGLQSLTRRSRELEETVAHRLSRATRSAERLSQLVESLLDVARISSGRFELRFTRLELGETLRELVDRLQDAAAQARCSLTLEVAGRIEGSWDRLRLEQIVMNLLGNAFKYAAGTPVRISAREEGGRAVVEIEDRGPGIPEEHLERIFSRFERAASIHQYGGLGLGLYVSQELARAHGGNLSARNVPGGGVCFELSLPLSPPAPAEPG